MLASAFSGLDSFSEDNVAQVMDLLADLNTTRLVITDPQGKALYDSQEKLNSGTQYFLLPEVVSALEGNDVFYCAYDSGAVESKAASPVMNYDIPIGAVYLMEYDVAQGELIESLENNLFQITVVLEIVVIVTSIIFSQAFSKRMKRILKSIQIARAGDYTYKVSMSGRDELRKLGDEFDALTSRLLESEERQRQFVSDASHELKTPLASIKLLSDSILQNEMDADMTREFVSDIGSEADRLTKLSAKLLELTKIDAHTEQTSEQMDISATVQRVARILAPQMEQRQIRFVDETKPGVPVLILEDDLYQIIFNLMENGIKYNVDGGLLRITLEQNRNRILLGIEDSGMGIPEEAMPHIFERFYRVDKARSRQAGGAGLGLSIVHDLVERNSGTIQPYRREEGGMRFTVEFPAIQENVQ